MKSSRKLIKTRGKVGNSYGSSYALQDKKKQALGNLWLWHSQDKIRMHRRSRRIYEEAFGRELHLKDHEDHIAGKGFNSVSHHNLSHKLKPMLQAMKIPDAQSQRGK